MSRAVLVLVLCVALGACSRHAGDAATLTDQAPQARRKTVVDDQLKALDKAKAVQKQLQDAKERQDKAIDDPNG